jgi:hypothetical protein
MWPSQPTCVVVFQMSNKIQNGSDENGSRCCRFEHPFVCYLSCLSQSVAKPVIRVLLVIGVSVNLLVYLL